MNCWFTVTLSVEKQWLLVLYSNAEQALSFLMTQVLMIPEGLVNNNNNKKPLAEATS